MSGLAQRLELPAAPAAALADPGAQGRIGPNAIIQLIEPLQSVHGATVCEAVFQRAGIARLLREPAAQMVPELAVRALFDALQRELGPGDAAIMLQQAGEGTARYVMRNRIPLAARTLLKSLPGPLASRFLLKAISRNAWTFAGSGRFTAAPGRPHVITIANNPIATPGCPWHLAVFTTLFTTLASSSAEVSHDRCLALGDASCRYTIHC